MLSALELDAELLPRGPRESRRSPGTAGDGAPGGRRRRRPGGRRARRRRRCARARCRSCWAPRASCSRPASGSWPTRRAALHAFCHAVPGAWHVMGVMLSAAGSLRLGPRRAGAGDCRSTSCSAAPADWPPGAEGLTFLPYLAGERTPHADPDARGAFVGLGLRHDRGALVRAVLEGVAFGLRDSLDLVDRARSAGSGARASFRRRRAQRAVAADRRLGAGAAARAGRGRRGRGVRRRDPRRGRRRRLGGRPTQPSPPPCQAARAVEPVAEWVEPYREQRERFRALYPALRGVIEKRQ